MHPSSPGARARAPAEGRARAAELRRVREVLQSVQGDQAEACAVLGISRATLRRRLRDEESATDAGPTPKKTRA